jgi:hypothetical protein
MARTGEFGAVEISRVKPDVLVFILRGLYEYFLHRSIHIGEVMRPVKLKQIIIMIGRPDQLGSGTAG